MKKDIREYLSKAAFLRIYKKLKKIPWILGKDAFLFILIFVLVDLMVGEFLFYTYVVQERSGEPVLVDATVKFKEDLYHSVLREMKERETVFNNPVQENYQDPFYKPVFAVPQAQPSATPPPTPPPPSSTP